MSVNFPMGSPNFPPGLKQKVFLSKMPWKIPITVLPFSNLSQLVCSGSGAMAVKPSFS